MLFLEGIERKLSNHNHHDQGHRQGATAIIEFFSVTHTSKKFEGARGRLCSSSPEPRHNGTMASPSLVSEFGKVLGNRQTDRQTEEHTNTVREG